MEADEGDLKVPVVIVGGGPVGMVLAMQLDAWGVESLIVNTEPDVRWHPKGNTHNARTMEHYRRLGIADQIRAEGLPPGCPTDVIYYTRFNGHELARLAMPSADEKRAAVEAAPATDQVPEPIHRANQMYVERVLADHLATLPRVSRRFGWQCTEFDDDGDGVTVHIERADGAAAARIRAAYLVGCDGGRSFVRRSLGIRYSGADRLDQAFFGEDMLSTYLRAPDIHGRIIRRPGWQYWAVSQDVRAALVSLNGDDEFLMLGRLRPGETPDNARLAQLVCEAAGEPIDVEIIGNLGWTGGQALVADSFGAGRVWLAGDAIHLFTPTGGFGMNTGIDDTANLAWKLAAGVRGWGGPGLLPSYEIERRPVALRNTSAAHALARNVGDVPVAADMESDSAAAAAARRAAGDFLAGFGEEFASIGIQLGARYDGSPLIATVTGDPPPDDPAVYVPSSVPGGRAPHVWLDPPGPNRTSLLDRLGHHFTLLRLGGAGGGADALADLAVSRGIPFKVVDVPGTAARDLYGVDFALVRPDQHVAWRGDRMAGDPAVLLDRVTGHG